jgi:hypothetical protein
MSSLVVFLLGAIALAFAPLSAAAGFVVVFVIQASLKPGPAAVMRAAARQFWRLKWLLLASFVLMALPWPGEPLAPGLPDFLPSREGLLIAAEQVTRVALVVLLFAAQPGMLANEQRVAALYRLLVRFGKGGERAALRIALTLRELEAAKRADHWQALRGGAAGREEAERCVIDLPALGAGDRWLIASGFLAFLACVLAALWQR